MVPWAFGESVERGPLYSILTDVNKPLDASRTVQSESLGRCAPAVRGSIVVNALRSGGATRRFKSASRNAKTFCHAYVML